MIQPILRTLPPSIRELVQALPSTLLERLEEIRIRQERALEVIAGGDSWFIGRDGKLYSQPQHSLLPSKEECTKMLNLISQHSLYAMEEELRRGYITVTGGHRIGLVGKVIVEQGRVKHLRDITGFNVRMARQVKGVGEQLRPHLIHHNHVENLLLISPPQCGKTTLLRDLARLASTGGEGYPSRKVGIVDERSEIAGCLEGVPQHDVGPRTDVLDACPKAEGMMMMIRSMSPEILVVDEIGSKEDSQAVHEAVYAGVYLFTTAHGQTVEEVCHRPALAELIKEGVFSRLVLLSRRQGPGTIEAIYDRSLRSVEWSIPQKKVVGQG